MQIVTQNEFFAALSADERDIMPVAKKEDMGIVSEWRENNKPWSPLWGRSEPAGYPGGVPTNRYFLAIPLHVYRVHNPKTMHDFGAFRAPSATVALDAMAKDAGYKNYAAFAEAGGDAIADEIVEERLGFATREEAATSNTCHNYRTEVVTLTDGSFGLLARNGHDDQSPLGATDIRLHLPDRFIDNDINAAELIAP